MAGKLASLIIKISANGAEAEKELKKLERKMSDFSKNLKKLGTDMSKYITAPITAMAGVSVAAANTQLQAEAKLLNALQGRSDVQQRLIKQAGELQSRSTLGDEAIIEQQAFLAALGLSEKQIGSTIEAAAQLSAALNIDLTSAVKNLAKTYGGMTGELGESIPALKNLTKEQLQAGDAIKYVNDNYKGFAETAASTGTGPLTQLKNIIGDIAESFGVILLPAIQKFAAKLKELALAFQQLSPEIKETIVTVAAIAAAIGPALVVFSKMLTAVKLVTLAMPALSAALTATAAGPIAAITAGVAALAAAWGIARSKMNAYMEDEGITDRKLARASKKIYNSSKDKSDEQIAKELVDAERHLERARAEGQERQAHYYEAQYIALSRIQRERAGEEDTVAKILATENAIASTIGEQNEVYAERSGIIANLTSKIEALEKAKKEATSELEIKRINAELSATKAKLEEISSIGEIKIVPVIEKPEGLKELALATGNNLLSADSLQGLAGLRTFEGMTSSVSNQMSAFWEDFAERGRKAADLIAGVTEIIEASLEDLAITMAEGIGDLWAGFDTDPGAALMEWLGNSLKSLGELLVKYAITMKAFKEALKNVYLDPLAAIALGLGITALGQYFTRRAQDQASKTPKLASGGLAYGPTLAVVGDNRGAASDPEVIAPLSKLRNYLGGQQLQLVGGVAFELRGDVVRAVLDRENFRLNRKG
jgi:hypothetical protein